MYSGLHRQSNQILVICLCLLTGMSTAEFLPRGDRQMEMESQRPILIREGYRDWRSRQQKGYLRYREDLEQGFETYQYAQRQEFERYRSSIKAVWDEIEVSTPKAWVEYSADRRIKRVVDCERNEIRIGVVEQGDRDVQEIVEAVMRDMLGETVSQAVRRDPVASGVEQRLSRTGTTVRKGKVEDRLVLEELFEAPRPTEAVVRRKVDKLLGRAHTHRAIARSRGNAAQEDTLAMVVRIPLPADRALRKAREYQAVVQKHGQRWHIGTALIMAIIHTESTFNPMATSHVPAYGMMQIVPRYAGLEATEKLWGTPTLLAPSYLYDPDRNIMIGAVYLHILYYEYFGGVSNPESRLFCTISAYNTGPGNVARAFIGKASLADAIPVINGMSVHQVYGKLRNGLPYGETRDYVQKVATRIKAYQHL